MKTPLDLIGKLVGPKDIDRWIADITTVNSICGMYVDLLREAERIVCAAIWYEDDIRKYNHQPVNIIRGYVICGLRHHNCLMTRAILCKSVERGVNIVKTTQGFLTSKNRFVDRQEAAQIAFHAGQIKDKKECLYSEDLY